MDFNEFIFCTKAKLIMQGFSVKELRKVIGVIDGSHISIKAPAINQENYLYLSCKRK